MQHLTMEDYRALFNVQDAPYPPHIQDHLETCERCAAVYDLLFAPARMGERTDDVGDPCASCDDVYEVFRNRLPLNRFIPLMYHLMQCEECADFFDLLWTREAPAPQALLAQEWLESAKRALASDQRHRGVIAVCEVTNVYAYAASGDDIVVETTGHLKNGATFTLRYEPDKTVFRVPTESIGQTRLFRREDDRWIEGWSETENGQSGCTMDISGDCILHLDEPDDPVGKTIQIIPYSMLKKVPGGKHAC